ncbi:MAG TPA: FliM/FliN family flagellar motor switch protein [Terriglobia bacterium]|nr:FliM/FliN family flagellar motor switch protein [Terriglobia bacterium]
MEKILSQEEINALLRAAQDSAGSSAGGGKERKFSPFVFGKASRISKQQVQDVAQVHEAFAYSLKNRLGAFLQVAVEVNAMSVDEVPYSEFIQSVPQQAYLASMNVRPANCIAILSLDLSVAFPMIDLMLGGDGKPEAVERPATEIEEKVLQTVVDMVSEELQMAWRQVVEMSFSFAQTERSKELFRLLPPYEKILFLSFEIRMPDVFSTMTLAFPAAASSMLLRKLAKKNTRSQSAPSESQARLRERLKDCVLAVEMLLPPTHVRGKDLLALGVGQTLLIQQRTSQPAVIQIAGRKMFAGYPVRSGKQRGGMIRQRFVLSSSSEKAGE